MNECGIDAEVLSSTMDFLLNGSSSNSGCPINLDLNFNQGEEGLEIVDYAPKIEDDDSSDDDRGHQLLKMHMRQACGNYSNEFIEEHWNENSKNSSTTDTKKAEDLRKQLKEIRESAMSLLEKKTTQPQGDQTEPMEKEVPYQVPDQRKKPSSKKKRPRFRNVAIESILGSKTGPTSSVETFSSPAQENLGGAVPSPSPMAAISNGSKPTGRDRARFPVDSDSLRSNFMIRPECINGYDANPDYDPNESCETFPKREDFPPL